MGKNMFDLLGEDDSMDGCVLSLALNVPKGKLGSKEAESGKSAAHNNSGKDQANGNGNYLNKSASRGGYKGSGGPGYTRQYPNNAENGNGSRYMTRRDLSEKEKKACEERSELRRKELEKEAKLMTLSQYEKLKQEKKGIRNKTEEGKEKDLEKARMMEMQKKFEGMQLMQKKKALDKDAHKSVVGTLKRNKSFRKDAEANKPVLINFQYSRRERNNYVAGISKEDVISTKPNNNASLSKQSCELAPKIQNEAIFPAFVKQYQRV